MTGTTLVLAAVAFAALTGTGLWLRPRLARRLDGIDTDGTQRVTGTLRVIGSRGGFGGFLRPYSGALTVTVLLALLGALLGLAAPWPMKLVVDNALGGRPLPASLPVVGGWRGLPVMHLAVFLGVALVAAASLVGYLVTYLVGVISLNVAADVRVTVFERLLHLPVLVHDRHRSGDLVTRLTSDVSRVQESLVARVQTLVPALATMSGMTALMVALDPVLAAVVLSAVPPLGALAVLRQRRVAEVQREARTRSGELAARAAEVMRHVRAVQTFGRQDHESDRFRACSGLSARAAGDAMDTSARLAPASDLVFAVLLGAVLWIGSGRVLSGRLSLGTLLVFLAYLTALRAPVRAMTRLAGTLGRGTASRERLAELLSQPVLPEPAQPASSSPDRGSDLVLDRVTFGYEGRDPVLDAVSMTVPAGRTTCLVGTTGAGKSTVLSLLLRLQDPEAGSVRIGGVDLRDMALDDVRSRVAFVPQDAWVMAGTIAENVRYGHAEATDEQVRAACAAALVDEFAGRLPDGYDTQVGDGGTKLSGGQRRRIALARALLRPHGVLVLDEPTAGLDASSERLVLEAIRQAAVDRTVLVVTHQLSLAEGADHVVVLAGGQVVQSGHPRLLRRDNGAYATLLADQSAVAPAGTSARAARRPRPVPAAA